MSEHMEVLYILSGIFTAIMGVLVALFGCFIWFFKRMVMSLEALHTKTLPVLSVKIQTELERQTKLLEEIQRDGPILCRHPLAIIQGGK